ncbi:MAG: hypothetical protein LBW85_02665 [Deltaproteobacteria bacterium]|jgi:hypothetical protein|nr:hypothetical protein [Deltaproteobacteria bacterium]
MTALSRTPKHVLFAFLPLLLPLLAVAIPARAPASDDPNVKKAYLMVIVTEEAYRAETGRYCDDYSELERVAGLVKLPDILYGPLTVYGNPEDNTYGFRFSLRLKTDGSPVIVCDNIACNFDPAAAGSLSTSVW